MRKNLRFRPTLLRGARSAGGYSRADLAELAGVSAATVKAWETGRRTPAPPAMARLARALGLAPEDLEVTGPPDAVDLTDLREHLGLSRVLACEHLGIDVATLAQVEAGLALPPDPQKMARVYGVTAATLANVTRRTGCEGPPV